MPPSEVRVREIYRLMPEERVARLKSGKKRKLERLQYVALQMLAKVPARNRAQRERRRREREERGN